MRLIGLLALCALAVARVSIGAETPPIIALNVAGAISPASAEYIERGLARASREGAQLVVLTLDTPGGLDTSMRKIVQNILASPIPVVTYVAPAGARAASAGTFILYASHVAAMAPGTNVGAASPVSIGLAPPATSPAADKGDKKAAPSDAHERKAMQDAAAYIRSLAQLRGRNADWGEKAVTEAASLSATEAARDKVIDLVATNDSDLVRKLDGRSITTANGAHTLKLAGVPTVAFPPDWHFRILAILTDPSVATILMLLGVYGLIFELANPGLVFPGVMGAVSLLLGLYALHLLPVNYAGLALMVLGLAFIVAEVFVPAYGSLGIGGVVAFVIGAMMLIDTDIPGFAIPASLIATLAVVSVVFLVTVAQLALRARRRPIVSGVRALVGAHGEMLEDASRSGWATIRGETWEVQTASPLSRGQRIRVIDVDGLQPRVAPIEDR